MFDVPTGPSSLGRTNGSVNGAGILLAGIRSAVVAVKPERASGNVTAAPATAPILSTSRRFNDIWVSPQFCFHDRRPFRRSSLRVLERDRSPLGIGRASLTNVSAVSSARTARARRTCLSVQTSDEPPHHSHQLSQVGGHIQPATALGIPWPSGHMPRTRTQKDRSAS